jgi:hypothetical protein
MTVVERHTFRSVIILLGCCVMGATAVAAEPRERSWIDRVERDRDRAAGRIVDEPTWETRRQQERRDVRMGRLRKPGRFEEFDEERDRRLQLDARARQADRDGRAAATRDGSVILGRPPSGGTLASPLAAQAAADERMLSEAKETLDRMLRAVNAAEQRALRALRRRLNREGRAGEFDAQSASVRERYERLRAAHRADYERIRSRILGR